MIVATAGHVDHGKSTLVKALTGVETDRLAEEKRRGLSIDLGFAYHDINGVRFGFVDVPGHEKFIRNMLSGVSAIDAALLVVAADDGVMPQTREHFDILRLLGIPAGIVAITKTDLASPERVAEVEQEVTALVAGSFLEGAPVLRQAAVAEMAAQVGADAAGVAGGPGQDSGLARLRTALGQLVPRERDAARARAVRMTIDRAFVIQGVGLTVTGTVIDGSISVGDRLHVLPGGDEVRVRAIRALDEPREQADTGQRCALNLSGIERSNIKRGCWLTGADNQYCSSRYDVRFTPVAGFTLPKREFHAHAHVAASHALARVSILQAADGNDGVDSDNGENNAATTWCQVVSDTGLPLRYGDHVILRDAADTRTVGCATVVDTAAPARGRQRPERLAFLRHIDTPLALDAVRAACAASPIGVPIDNLLSARGLPVAEREVLAAQIEPSYLRGRERWVVSAERFAALRSTVIGAVDGWHKASPHTSGIRLNQLQQVTAKAVPRGGAELLTAVIDRCVSAGELIRSGGIYRRPQHAPALVGEDRKLWERIKPALAGGGRQPPVTREIAQQAGINHTDLLKFLARIAHLGLTVKLADNRYFLPETVDELLAVVRQVAAADPQGHITPIAFRDASGIGRNLAIALLEHLDQKGITRRHGDFRVLTGLRD